MRPTYKSVVFDMDGTLIDSQLCFVTIKKALDIPDASYILEHLAGIDESLRAEKHRRLEEFEVQAARDAVLMEGVRELFARLKVKNLRTGIFTRNCRAATNVVLEKFSLPVDSVITREDAPPKPDPEGLLQLLKAWGHSPEDMLYVGDYRFDIECGRRAGVRTVLYTVGKPTDDDFGADFMITSYNDFPENLRWEK